jgi:hypothetical protein
MLGMRFTGTLVPLVDDVDEPPFRFVSVGSTVIFGVLAKGPVLDVDEAEVLLFVANALAIVAELLVATLFVSFAGVIGTEGRSCTYE